MNGTMATGGGLIFVGRADGRFTALDSSNGNQIWEFQTDAGVSASASTFEHRGKQYVVVLSAGSAIGQNKRGDSVWLFSLDGTMESLPPDAGAPTPAAPGGPGAAQQGVTLPPGATDLAKGQAQYRTLCMGCHGESGMGGQNNGVSLQTIARTPAGTGQYRMERQEQHAAVPRFVDAGTDSRHHVLHFGPVAAGAPLRSPCGAADLP